MPTARACRALATARARGPGPGGRSAPADLAAGSGPARSGPNWLWARCSARADSDPATTTIDGDSAPVTPRPIADSARAIAPHASNDARGRRTESWARRSMSISSSGGGQRARVTSVRRRPRARARRRGTPPRRRGGGTCRRSSCPRTRAPSGHRPVDATLPPRSRCGEPATRIASLDQGSRRHGNADREALQAPGEIRDDEADRLRARRGRHEVDRRRARAARVLGGPSSSC